MLGQQAHARECLGARCTRVFFDIGMGLQMCAQVRFVGERTMAELATEWLVAGVCADVTVQQPWTRECFAAQMAFAWFGMCANVHFQGALRVVRLRAVIAFEGLLGVAGSGCCAMELFVFVEARMCGIGFGAISALVTWHFILQRASSV